MSFSHDTEAKLNIYGGVAMVNKSGLVDDKLIGSMVRSRLVEQFACTLAQDAIIKTDKGYSYEYHLQVYVLTPAQLEKYVQRRAERLRSQSPNMEWLG
jgi:hypothetical protein